MPTEHRVNNAAILAGEAHIPDHVVYRAFVQETVVLNLQTGQYHGLNPTAGRMFELLDRGPTVQDAARQIAEEYDKPLAEVEDQLCKIVARLLDRGLIELNSYRQE